MGKKVSPHSIRIGITRTWDSFWFSRKNFKDNLIADVKIRKYLTEKFKKASLAKVEIQRDSNKIITTLHTGKPGLIIGRSGEKLQELTKELQKKFSGEFDIKVQEIRKPDASAQIVANSIAEQIEKRFPFRRVCKMALERAKENGVKGIKIKVSGRLNGVDIARSEGYNSGKVPLQTLRANIDYAMARAETTYGTIGVKVWIYHGLVFRSRSDY